MNAFCIPEPSLSSRAMLCSLSISMWSARKHDPEASEEIAQRPGAQADAGRYHKVLLPKEALAEIHKVVSEARQEHYFMTLPWDDNGYRVLAAAAYMDHTEKMRALSNRFSPAVEALVQQFGQLVEEAKVRLYEAVSHMAERLQAYKVTEEGVEHPFRDSIVTRLVHRSISPLYFATAGNLSAISPEGAQENSLGRKPWENVRPLSPKPRRGDRSWANLAASFAPTGAPGKKIGKRSRFPRACALGYCLLPLRG